MVPPVGAAITRHRDLGAEEINAGVRDVYAVHHSRVKLNGCEGVVVGLETAACAHAAESGNLTDTGASAIALRTDVAARHHHLTSTVADFFIGHLAGERADLLSLSVFSGL